MITNPQRGVLTYHRSGEIKKLTNAQRCHIFLEGDDKGKRAFNDNLKKVS